MNPPAHPSALAAGAASILLVDDEADLLQLAALILQHLGHHVTTAKNGLTALDILQKAAPHTFDLLITDLMMPDLNGQQLARHCMRLSPETRILFCSGYSPQSFDDQIPAHFLSKPYTIDAMASMIDQILAISH